MSISDNEARDMMFGDLEIEKPEGESLENESLENEDLENIDIDIDNDEEIKELTKQSPKLNAAFAKFRRQNQEYDSKLKKFNDIVSGKYKDGYGIENVDQFFDHLEKQTEEETEEEYNSAINKLVEDFGLDPDEIKEVIKKSPDNIKAQQILKDLETQKENEILNKRYEATFKELQTEYPKFKTVEDINIILGDKAAEFWDLFTNKNIPMLNAYEIADRENLKKSNDKATEQKTLNKIKSKSHLKPTKLNADVDYTDQDPEELAWYEAMVGDKWTHQQMIEHSKKNR